MSGDARSVVGIDRVCVEYDGEHVLEDVELTIVPGEFVALLGPNGSGKTTLIRALLGLETPVHGHISLFDQPLERFRSWDRVALVPQRLPSSSSIPVSVWEAVLAGRISPRRRWRPFSRDDKASAAAALADVGLEHRRHERLDTLSGGQQRRVMIARALATGADLLVMDEPTAGLDAENLDRLTEILGELKARGTTIVVVTHELTGIAHLVTRAIVLEPHARVSVAYDGPPNLIEPSGIRAGDDHPHHDEPAADGPASPIGFEP